MLSASHRNIIFSSSVLETPQGSGLGSFMLHTSVNNKLCSIKKTSVTLLIMISDIFQHN